MARERNRVRGATRNLSKNHCSGIMTISNPQASGTLDCWVTIMNTASTPMESQSHGLNRARAKTSRVSSRTSSGVNRSGISSETIQGSALADARKTESTSSHHPGTPMARRVRSNVTTVSTACARTTGQVVSPRCSGSMNRL